MEHWEKQPPRRCGGVNPSFSSTLLDSIYRSIDDESSAGASRHGGDRRPPPPPPPAVRRKPDRRTINNSTSSSSDCSSYGGFSSSEPETAAKPAGLRPIRTGLRHSSRIPPPPPPQIPPEAIRKPESISRKLRDLRSGKPPASPGARLANFLNSLLAAAAGSKKKAKETECSTASSSSRSCLSKTPSTRERRGTPASGGGGKRSVRFYPVSVIVDEDCRPCGHKSLHDGDRMAWIPPPPPPTVPKNRVDRLMRGFEDDLDSDSSSDLFELENLTAVSGGGGRYRDELPVYKTTQLRSHRAMAQGFVL